jgi:mannose-6-phosphate isomerase-like protein (cupin superfamily)
MGASPWRQADRVDTGGSDAHLSKTATAVRAITGRMNDQPIVLAPGAGRAYQFEAMRGVFKADGPETGDRYCVSEWSVEPGMPGPGPHHHESEEELFLVTEGTMSFRLADDWIDAPVGTFIRIPAGVTHDFENRSGEPATTFNVSVPGGFEAAFGQWAPRAD